MDVTTTRFLLKNALLRKKEEEEKEKRKEEVLQRKRDGWLRCWMCCLSTGPQTSRVGSRRSRVSTVRQRERGRRGGRGVFLGPLLSSRLVIDSDSGICRAGLPGVFPRAVFRCRYLQCMCWLVLLVTLHLALCSSSLLSMSVAIPQVQFLDRLFCLSMKPWRFAQKTADIPQLLFFDMLVLVSVVVQRPIPMRLQARDASHHAGMDQKELFCICKAWFAGF